MAYVLPNTKSDIDMEEREKGKEKRHDYSALDVHGFWTLA